MAKRRQTTGLPKQKQRSSTSAEQSVKREQRSRAEREAEIQRYVLIGTGVVVGIVALILLIAVVVELLITPNQVVATVNGEAITVAQFEERVRLERALLNQRINNYAALIQAQGGDINQFAGQEPLRTWLSQVQIPDQLGNSVLNAMIEDRLVRQQAEELGITVSQEAIDEQIVNFLGFSPEDFDDNSPEPSATPSPTITPTPFVSPTPTPLPTATATSTPLPESTEEATAEATAEVTEESQPTFTPLPPTATLTAAEQAIEQQDSYNELRNDFFNATTSAARISRDRLNEFFESMALREAVRDATTELSSTEVPHVNARHILVATEEEAQDVIAALEAGKSFALLAQAVSTDGSGQQGGELGWAPVTRYVTPFAEAVETGEIDAVLGPVQSEFGWHVIQVRAREIREISEDDLENAQDGRFSQMLEEQRTAEDANIEINDMDESYS